MKGMPSLFPKKYWNVIPTLVPIKDNIIKIGRLKSPWCDKNPA